MSELIANLSFLISSKQAADIKAAAIDRNYVMQHGDAAWKINNSHWHDHSEGVYFPSLGKSMQQIVAELQTTSTVGLDIAGGTNGTAMLDLIESGILSRAAVTNYEAAKSHDPRANYQLAHISGDLLASNTWYKILRWQQRTAPDGLKLITHEPRDTLQWFSPEIYEAAGALSIRMLESKGLFIAQKPRSLSRAACSSLCRNLAACSEVQDIAVSKKHRGDRQILIIKA